MNSILVILVIIILLAAGAIGALTLEHGWGWVLAKYHALLGR